MRTAPAPGAPSGAPFRCESPCSCPLSERCRVVAGCRTSAPRRRKMLSRPLSARAIPRRGQSQVLYPALVRSLLQPLNNSNEGTRLWVYLRYPRCRASILSGRYRLCAEASWSLRASRESSWGSPADSDAAAASTATDASGLEEITVTAERYISTIQNTPISISALSGQELQAQGITTIQEIAKDVPGLSMRYAGPGPDRV